MAVTSNRKVVIAFSEDLVYSQAFPSAENLASPGDIDILDLASGANTITLPTGGSTVTGATIIPPAGNTIALTLKGVGGDTGIGLHLTDPVSISFASPAPTDFVLTAGDVITGLRIVWT